MTAGPSEAPAYLLASVDRALQTLLLLQADGPLTLTAVARHLDVAPSTAHRLLATLAHRGFVTQHPGSKAYAAGRVLVEIGLASVGNLDVRRAARPELEALARDLDETVHLARLEGDHVLFLDTVESTRAVRVTDRTGVTLPAWCTASGKVLLAAMPQAALRSLLPARLPAVTPRTTTSRAELEVELAEVRQTGFAVNVAESERGLSAVAVAVGEAGVSVTVSVPSEHLTGEEIAVMATAARAAAARIAARLR